VAIQELQPGRQFGPIGSQPEITFPSDLTFGARVRQLRTERGLKQKDLADRLHIDISKVSGWETGTTLPKSGSLGKLREGLQLSPDGIEINQLMTLYEAERIQKRSNHLKPEENARLERRLRDISQGPINYSTVARELGISIRSVTKKHRELKALDRSIPANIRDAEAKETLAFRIRAYRRAGYGIRKIARILHTSQLQVTRVLKEIGDPKISPNTHTEPPRRYKRLTQVFPQAAVAAD
jgi:predicted transcriptional regulator